MAEKMDEKVKQIFDRLQGTVFLTDAESKILYANYALSQETGFEPAEIVGRRPGDLWGGRMGKEFYARMWSVIKGKKEPFISQFLNVKKGGLTYRTDAYIAPILDREKQTEYFIAIQPGLKNLEQKCFFQGEFGRRFSQPAQSMDIVEWLIDSLDSHDKKALADFKKTIYGAPQTLSEFFSVALVKPNLARYGERQKDYDLVRAAKADTGSFQAIYLKYWHEIYYYFLRRTGYDGGASSELSQETFLRAFQHLSSFVAKNASYRTYLLRIAHNILVNYFRRQRTVTIDEAADVAVYSEDSDFLLKESMWRAVADLSPVERQVLELKYRQDLPVRELALILNKSENAVKLILSRARKKLRERL